MPNRPPHDPDAVTVAREAHARLLKLETPRGTAPRARVIKDLRSQRTYGGVTAMVRVVRACYDEGVPLERVREYLSTGIWYAENLYASSTPRRPPRPRAA